MNGRFESVRVLGAYLAVRATANEVKLAMEQICMGDPRGDIAIVQRDIRAADEAIARYRLACEVLQEETT